MFALLGPVQATVGGRTVDLGSTKQRIVLAVLLAECGRPVSVDSLVDRVWDTEPPVEARRLLSTYVSRIRRVLDETHRAGGERVELRRQSGGYQLCADPELVDVHRFHRLVRDAEDTAVPDRRRAELLTTALELWRDRALCDLPGGWAARTREIWLRQRLDIAVTWARTELRLNRPERMLDPLRRLLAEQPLVEPLSVLLMRALSALGRDSEALDLYATTRAELATELGADPGPELRAVHESVLRGSSVRPQATQLAGVPRQLPAPPWILAARGRELAQLDATLAADPGRALVISVVGGVPGIGKTWLALHWAHRNVDRFPDGQLFVNLRGSDPTAHPTHPKTALRGFLDALDVPPHMIPSDEEAQAALYRSLTAGRKILVVLDNARDTEQVLPLLPGCSTCTVLVTSRNRLAGLAGTHGARLLTLDVLGDTDVRDLLGRYLGHDRIAAEPHAVAELVEACGGLPLAVGAVAARAAAQPGSALWMLAGELSDASARTSSGGPVIRSVPVLNPKPATRHLAGPR
ncbi:BTAD domain-containing putative transcriptional regulator [Streptomyces sp. NPDC058694]|uniref:AfsR/SARP family transcriptional regulator n=1 Tax=Streptomyces sp. NPDC058694 TaxID=3346603 RepID=UPI003650B84C